VAGLLIISRASFAHDLEKTQVSIVFARDGSFIVDVKNDPAWLKLRLESIPGPFADRIVMWVDGREIRPESVEFSVDPDVAIHRLRGRVPVNAKSLRWYYGLVIDPYPLTIRRADGRISVEEIGGDAWSGEIDIGQQFDTPSRWPTYFIVGLLAIVIAIRVGTSFRK
jgi:hypothetical protein